VTNDGVSAPDPGWQLYRLVDEDREWWGGQVLARSDEDARLKASDRESDTLHKRPHLRLEHFLGQDRGWELLDDAEPIVPAHPPTPPHPPLDRSPTEIAPVDLFEHQPERLRLGEITVARRQVLRAIRQLARAQESHRAEQARRVELGFVDGLVPDDLVALDIERSDAMTFAVLAIRQAIRARFYLTSRGLDLPAIRQDDEFRALRDLTEHWDGWEVLHRHSYASDERWLRTPAGRRWAEATGGRRPHGGLSYSGGPPPDHDPNSRITSWNGIDIDHATEDLQKLLEAIEGPENEAFEYEWPDEQAAVEAAGGPAVWTLIRVFTTLRGRKTRDGTVRFERADVLAAAAAVSHIAVTTTADEHTDPNP
jgi:hypothetical protein